MRADSLLREPPPLTAGSHVFLLSPSGPLAGPEQLEQATNSADSLGWRITVGSSALLQTGYFAGSDDQRAFDLNAALRDESVDGIWCLRGGYGAARLLPLIDDALREMAGRDRTQALMGYSDITALHAAWQRHGMVSYHGPTARSALSPFSRMHFVNTVQYVAKCDEDGRGQPYETILSAEQARCLIPGRATGRLAGGNLALLASLCGTPWEMDLRGAIVVLEDIDEASYRVDRMLTQLMLAGSFDECAGFAFGQFTNCPDSSHDATRPVDAILNELALRIGVPAIMGVPVGHIEDQWTLPLGAVATLDADGRTLTVSRTAVQPNTRGSRP